MLIDRIEQLIDRIDQLIDLLIHHIELDDTDVTNNII